MKFNKELIESRITGFEKMSFSSLMAVIPSLLYNSTSDNFEILSKERFALACALSRSWIEFGMFDFELIRKWTFEMLESV